MSTTVKIKVKDLNETMNNFGYAAAVQCGEHEDPTLVKKFKYAAGKNYTRIREAALEVEKRQQSILNDYRDPEFDEYQKKRTATCEQFCERDDDDNPKLKEFEDDRLPQYIIPEGIKEEFKVQTDALQAEYQDAIDRYNANTEAAEAIFEEEVEIEVYQFPYDDMPSNVSGGYMVSIECMLTGLPDLDNDQ